MQNPAITNEAPFDLYFSLPKFYLVQSNYKATNEIIVTNHTSREFLSDDFFQSTVAVFKVRPHKHQPLVITEAGELEAYETMFR